MTTCIQNTFHGGHAEDIRTHNTDECEFSTGFDILTNPHALIPYSDTIAETIGSGVSVNDAKLTNVSSSLISTDYKLIAIGKNASNNKLTFYKKFTTAIDSVWASVVQVATANDTPFSGAIFSYKGLTYALSVRSTTYTLYQLDSASAANIIGTITYSAGSAVPNLFVHPKDNVLYIIVGNIIATWDGSSYATSTTILPTYMSTSSITDYGDYLAIGMFPISGVGESVTYLWGRDITLNTLQQSINMGEGTLQVLENLNEVLFAVMQSPSTYAIPSKVKMSVKAWSGGAVETLKEFIVATYPALSRLGFPKAKSKSRIYFGLGGTTAVYLISKNKSGKYIVTQDRYYHNGTNTGNSSTADIQYISIVGDIFWFSFNTANTNYFQRSMMVEDTPTYTSTAIYRTTINPSMPLDDRNEKKQLDAVQISYLGNSTGVVNLKYSVDGGSWVSIIAKTVTTAVPDAVEATNEADGTVFNSGDEFQFQIETTGGNAPIELKYRYTNLNATI